MGKTHPIERRRMGSSPLSVFLYKKEGELKIMHIKRIMVAALAAAMVVTATAPAFAETGNMELEQKDPVQAEEIITPEERKENAEKIETEKKEVAENENSKKQIMINIFDNGYAAAKDYGSSNNLVVGSNIAGFLKVYDAMIAQGVV